MAILKGQNFRILTQDADSGKYRCVGMASNCTINLTGNTEDASTKDDLAMSSKPTIVSKGWSVSCESLSVADYAEILNAVKNLVPFTLVWDETSVADNQTAQGAEFARKGVAYLNDVTFNFNDRENSSKSLQFTGSGPLEKLDAAVEVETYTASSTFVKGQAVRLFLGSDNTVTPERVVASAKSLSVHVSMSLENSTTKDTDGDWQTQEPTALAFDISTSALVRSGDTITSTVQGQSFTDVQDIYEASAPVKFQIAEVSGANNRTKGNVMMSGSVVITSLNIQAGNRQSVTYDASLSGYGIYTVGA